MSHLIVALIVALVQILFWLGCALWVAIIGYSLWGFLSDPKLESTGTIKKEDSSFLSLISLLAVPLVALAIYPVLKKADLLTAAVIGVPLFLAIVFTFSEVSDHPAEAIK